MKQKERAGSHPVITRVNVFFQGRLAISLPYCYKPACCWNRARFLENQRYPTPSSVDSPPRANVETPQAPWSGLGMTNRVDCIHLVLSNLHSVISSPRQSRRVLSSCLAGPTRWGNWGLERIADFLQVARLISDPKQCDYRSHQAIPPPHLRFTHKNVGT